MNDMPSQMASIGAIRALLSHDLSQTEALIAAQPLDIPIAANIIDHVVKAGGKRLRPLVLLLWARYFGYEGAHHHALAASLELVHTATLLHDDVVDDSPLRRGQPTAKAIWGNQATVLTGDYLYAQSFTLLAQCQNPAITLAVSTATSQVAQGELLQLFNRKNTALTEAQYLHILGCKTGQLFELASTLPGHLTGQSQRVLEHLGLYGMSLGLAFQLMDDVLDYTGDAAALGKRVGDDLADGNLTLPIIYALQHANPTEQARLEALITEANLNELPWLQQFLTDIGAIAYTRNRANAYKQQALNALATFAPNTYTEALAYLCEFSCERNH